MEIVLQPKQQIAFTTNGTEVLYGGAAGGGKSYLKRASAIRWCMEVGGVQVYLFRRTLRDLRDNHLRGPTNLHVMLAEHLKSGHVKYRGVENEFEFWNGSRLHLCYCDSENDVQNYDGAEIHVLMMDELTHFTEYQYRFLRHRVRVAGLKIPEQYKGRLPRIECASNPGSIGHAWVKRTFISPKPALEVWKCSPDEGGMRRQYIPAKLQDNPYLTKDDPEYADRLRGMGSDSLSRAKLDGDWDIVAGQAFEKLRRNIHCIEPFDPPQAWQVFGSLDWGSSRPFSFCMFTVSNGDPLPDGRVYQRGAVILYNELYGWNGKPNEGLRWEVAEVADAIKAKWCGRRPAYISADPSMWKVDGSPSHAETMMGRGVILRKADNSRLAGYLQMRGRIVGNEEGPMFYATSNCHAGFWRTVPDLVMDEHHPEDVDTNQEDHCFVSDTLVCTYNGLQRIGDLVGSEGLVWSCGKWEPYRSCRMTRRNARIVELKFDDGTRVRCTPDHRFMLESGEWCEANELPGKRILLSSVKLRRSFLASATGYAGSTFNDTVSAFTARCGRLTTALSLMASTFTIWTRTAPITAFKTLSRWMGLDTYPCTARVQLALNIHGCTLSAYERRLLSGMEALRDWSGTAGITKNTVQLACTGKPSRLASTAQSSSRVDTTRTSVPTPANQHGDGQAGGTISKNNVLSAITISWEAFTRNLRLALSSAGRSPAKKNAVVCLSLKEAGRADVYCLTVPTQGRFCIESGLVVSNCYDSVRYGLASRPWLKVVAPTERKKKDWLFDEKEEADSWRTA